MWEERNESKKELFSKKETELKDLEILSLSVLQQNEKACSEKNTKGVVQRAFDKSISVGVSHGPHRLPQQKHC